MTTIPVEAVLSNAKALSDLYQETLNIRSGELLAMYQRAVATHRELYPQAREADSKEFGQYAMLCLAIMERGK